MSDVMRTPGPWTAFDASGENVIGPNVVWEVADALGLRLATVHTMGIGVDTGKANGELMAAAPDMLAELRRIEEMFATIESGDVPYRELTPCEAERLGFVRQTIAKATGDSA